MAIVILMKWLPRHDTLGLAGVIEINLRECPKRAIIQIEVPL